MSIQVSQIPALKPETDTMRRMANFHPSIWGDRFVNCISEEKVNHAGDHLQEIEQLKEEVRRELLTAAADSAQLNLIAAIQCLRVGYLLRQMNV